MSNPPPDGHIRLILVPDSHFYLEVPPNIIRSLCLVYLGWCIEGARGLAEHHGGERMSLDDALDDHGLYYNVTNGHTGKLFLHVVLHADKALIVPPCSMKISAGQPTARR